jgi:ABC-type multidrug transport system permease subunit
VNDDSAVAFRSTPGQFWDTLLGTAGGYVKRSNAYLVLVLPWVIGPAVMYATWQLTYAASGREQVAGANVSGFLLVGMVGLNIWTATTWSSGYAIQHERHEGTVAALFLSPASRIAVVAGYGLGGMVWLLPAFAVVALLGLVTGARFQIATPLAPLLAVAVLLIGSLATGFALAGLFILSRRANLIANFLQLPIYLLAGFVVPREQLPGWLQSVSAGLPVSHGIEALRASSLRGAGLSAIGSEIGLALLTSAVFALVGVASLRRVEHVAKRGGQLELF